jgi:Protein of unknown function (DUF2752)
VTHAIEGDHPGLPGHVPAYVGPPYLVAEPSRFSRFVLRAYERTPRWVAPAAIATCFAGAASFVLISDPTDAGAADPPGCLVKLTTGLDCPGCGGTRAFYYLLRGNLPEAARYHAVAVFAAPFLVWLYVAWAIRFVTGRRLPMPRIGAKTIAVFLGVWAVFMVLRNIPIAPFTWFYV